MVNRVFFKFDLKERSDGEARKGGSSPFHSLIVDGMYDFIKLVVRVRGMGIFAILRRLYLVLCSGLKRLLKYDGTS